MKEENTIRKVYGLSREEEEKQLAEIIEVAQENLERMEKYNKELVEELNDMREAYEAEDKDILVLWNNAKSKYQENKEDLMRCLKAREKPYFGRIDFKDPKMQWDESYYVGRVGIAKNGLEPLVIDWRAPIASVYYENTLGPCTYEVKNHGLNTIDLKRKRTYEIAKDKLIDFFDSDVVANDELLTKYLAKSKKAVLSEIIGTIQKEQNAIIRTTPKINMIVQGAAGSGKTTVAMHRISYILYNYETFRPQDFYIIGSNRILLNYITSVLPDLDVYGVSQMTMEELFIRLLYEDWDSRYQKVGSLDRKDSAACIKGSYDWFHDLEKFCWDYEKTIIPSDPVIIEKNGVQLLSKQRIETYIKEHTTYSMQSKIDGLNEMLLSKLENELTAKSVSYTPEEKKELNRISKDHFGKDEWKGSIYELYHDFIELQRSKGFKISLEENTYDVYDLAALAYLYKRIKETDGIREATHIIIDEAQDFGMMAYSALTYCLRGCTYTIMGDVSQNIYYGYGLNDWNDLKKLVLSGVHDRFGLLKKSYRNTVEISHFATEILRHGNFPIYPVEPIIRHGNEVSVTSCDSEEQILERAEDQITKWQQEGHETIAVVCRDETEAASISTELSKHIKIADSDIDTAVFNQGVMVLPVEYTKGLEFDAVLIYNPTAQKYPAEDQYVKLLYVAATRALHELAVLHMGDLTELIAKPVSAEKRMSVLQDQNQMDPVDYRPVVFEVTEEEKAEELERFYQRTMKNYLGPKKEEATPKASVTTKVEKPVPAKPYQAKPLQPKRDLQPVAEEAKNKSAYEFNSTVESTMLTPGGHSKIESSIKWLKKEKTYVDLISSYGILRLTPVDENIIRIQFMRGQAAEFEKGHWDYKPEKQPSWTVRKSAVQYEVATGKIAVRIDKNTGVMHFYDKKGKMLLQESGKMPRQMDPGIDWFKTWNYFDWPKSDRMYAKGMLDDDLQRLNGKARYISFGGKRIRMPLILSDQGYGLGMNAEQDVIYCDIPMYGKYIYTSGMKQMDYYFLYGGKMEDAIGLYKKVTK